MSLTLSGIAYLARLQRKIPLDGPALLYGRQMIFGTYDQVKSAMLTQGLEPLELSNDFETGQIIPDLKCNPRYMKYTNDRAVFAALAGLETTALDISKHQNPDICFDLQHKAPTDLRNRFGLVFDGGTVEHVFDIKSVLDNTVTMLKEGGRVVHITPISGFVDHGYYQISPLLLFDYYRSRGFENLECLIAELPTRRANHSAWSYWYWDPNILRKQFLSEKPLLAFFTATKSSKSGSTTLIQNETDAQGYRGKACREHETKPWGLRAVEDLSYSRLSSLYADE